MKIKNYIYLLFAASITMFAGCKYDNYTAPQSVLSGTVGYLGQGIGVKSNAVQLELWQYGWQLRTKIAVYVKYDGTYAATLFDGNYKLTYLKAVGPWVTKTDTLAVTVKGNTVFDFPVEPFYIIKSSSFVKGTRTNVALVNGVTVTTIVPIITGTVTLQRVNTTQPLQAISIYLNQGLMMDNSNSLASVSFTPAAGTDLTLPIPISVDIPSPLSTYDYLYARVGVKTNAVSELAYGVSQQVTLK